MTNDSATALKIYDHVATLTLNRPEKHNAFDDFMIDELLGRLEDVKNNDALRVLVLQAEGKNFCAGADLGWMKRMAQLDYDGNLADAKELARLMNELNSLPIPTIARVQGAAFGGAIGLIACCDIAIASKSSRFCLSEVKLGLAPATISPFVIDAMGVRRCRQLFLTAEVFNASEAERYGLLHKVVSLEALDEAVDETVSQLVNVGPRAAKAAKRLIHHINEQSGELTDYTSQLIAELRVSEEGQEGLSAFFEKRNPSWREPDLQ